MLAFQIHTIPYENYSQNRTKEHENIQYINEQKFHKSHIVFTCIMRWTMNEDIREQNLNTYNLH